MTVPCRVLLIDDHPVVRSGLALLLESTPEYQLCGEAGTVADAQAAMTGTQPDLVVFDLMLGGRDGLELLGELKALRPAARFLVYTMQAEHVYGRRALRAGAHGYLVKSAGLPAVREALAVLARGERYMSPALARVLIEEGLGGPRSTMDDLSDRELQVLRLVAAGRELGEIAAELNLSVKTVGTYRERLKNKLGLDSARELAREALALFASNPPERRSHA
jgi:DNA-binding NarL/FixJ family response regulator